MVVCRERVCSWWCVEGGCVHGGRGNCTLASGFHGNSSQLLIGTCFGLTANLPPHFATSQVSSVRKQLKVGFHGNNDLSSSIQSFPCRVNCWPSSNTPDHVS